MAVGSLVTAARQGKKGHVEREQSGFVRCKSLLESFQVTSGEGGEERERDRDRDGGANQEG